MGINGVNGGGVPYTNANEAYLYSIDDTLNIGALGSAAHIIFHTTGGTSPVERMRLTSGGLLGLGTSTPSFLNSLTIATTTGNQLALSAGAGLAQWAFRNAGGDFFLSTTTVAGTATTSISALTISGSGFGTTTVRGLNISGFATSTSNVGFNITSGCYAVYGTCISGGGGSLSGLS